MPFINELMQDCPCCNGKGEYQEYDKDEADRLYNFYIDVFLLDSPTAWRRAEAEVTQIRACKRCMKKGKILTLKGKQVLSLLRNYA